MKSVKPSTRTSKQPRVEAFTAAPDFGDQPTTVDPAKEIHVDPIAAVDPAGDVETINPTATPPLSLCAMMETFMTTKAAHEQLIDELLTEVTALRANFTENGSAFPPPLPSDS